MIRLKTSSNKVFIAWALAIIVVDLFIVVSTFYILAHFIQKLW